MALIKDNSDQKLLELLKDGNKEALTEIYARYAKILLKFTAQRLNDVSDTEDAIHDIFLKLWQSGESNSIINNLQSYLPLPEIRSLIYIGRSSGRMNT